MINSEYFKILKPGMSRETYSLSSFGSQMWKKYVVLDEKGSRRGDFSDYITCAGISCRLSYTWRDWCSVEHKSTVIPQQHGLHPPQRGSNTWTFNEGESVLWSFWVLQKSGGGSEFAMPVQEWKGHAFEFNCAKHWLWVCPLLLCCWPGQRAGWHGRGCRGWWREQRRDVTELSLNRWLKSAGQSGRWSGPDISHKRDFLFNEISCSLVAC